MRIAYVCTENLPVPPVRGGAVQTHISGILPYTSRLHDITVFCVESQGLPARESVDGVNYVRLPVPTKDEYVGYVADELQSTEFDLIHVFNRPAWVPRFADAAPEARFGLRIHNAMFELHKITDSDAERCIETVSFIDTVSDFMGQKIIERFPQANSKHRTIYSGVDLHRIVPGWMESGASMRTAMRRSLGLSDEPVVLFVGRLSQNKGPHVLIPMMERVLATIPDAVLVVVGSRWFGSTETNEYIDSLKASAEGLGDHVRFTGYVPALEIEKAYAIGDVFVCTSQWEEPLARVHFEAMAAGLPVVTTVRGGNPEVVYDGINGYVIDEYENPEAFAKPVISLLADKGRQKELGERARTMAECRYSFARTAAETLDLYDRALFSSKVSKKNRTED